MKNPRKPGDVILDRYLPSASPEVREEARRRLYAYVGTLLKTAMRLDEEAMDSPESDGRRKMIS